MIELALLDKLIGVVRFEDLRVLLLLSSVS